jgi:hypothetical protein
MRFRSVFALVGAALALVAPSVRAQPVVELAPEHQAPPPPPRPLVGLGAGTAPDNEVVWGLVEQRFRSAAASVTHTSVGGYGDIQLEGASTGGARTWTVDLDRVVIFVAHTFTDTIRIYTEFEWEHAKGCSDCKGEASVEQAYVEWKVLDDYLGLRGGLILLPVGIINEWHEPPVFNGVNRPDVETSVIPTTWREVGVGVFGHPLPWLRYQAYAMTALAPLSIGEGGLAGGQQEGSIAAANAWSGVARVEAEPVLGAVVGVSGYGSDAGPNAKFYDARHKQVGLSVPIFGWDVDARIRRHGLEAKLLYTEWYLPNAGGLQASLDEHGDKNFPDPTKPVPTKMRGGYVELGYDVLHPFHLSHQLVPFVRPELYETQAAVPAGTRADGSQNVREVTAGLSYRPIQQVVFKSDFQFRRPDTGPNENQINFGIGFMY